MSSSQSTTAPANNPFGCERIATPDDSRRDNAEWRNWPTNCRNFRPGLQDASQLLDSFRYDEEKNDLRRPKEEEVFHITEYSADGNNLRDQFLNEEQLEDYLSGTNQPPCEQACKFRLFFATSDRSWKAATQSYMRRWWSRYSAPMDVAAAIGNEPAAVFRTLTEDVAPITPITPPRRIFHIWLGCDVCIPPLQREELGYYRGSSREDCIAQENRISVSFYPSIYIQYDVLSGETTILVMDYSPVYSALRRTCENAHQSGIATNPFAFLVSYLNCVLESINQACTIWSRHLKRYEKSVFRRSNYSSRLRRLSEARWVDYDMSNTLALLEECIWRVRDEHRRFATIKETPTDLFNFMDDSFQHHAHDLRALTQLVKSYDAAGARHIEILLGLTQIRHGDSMCTIAEENQKQAEAAQAIARDAKRDSEIMKTITVVTLIYLPATFVCTLLSMGIFEWPDSGDGSGGGGGGVRLAKTGWIYLAIAIPLTIITCGIAWWKYSRSSTRALADLENQSDQKDLDGDIDPKKENGKILDEVEGNGLEVRGSANRKSARLWERKKYFSKLVRSARPFIPKRRSRKVE